MTTPEDFLESKGFVSKNLNRSALITAFQKEMEAGLAGEKSSLMMIPSYVDPTREVIHDTAVAVLDAGGTNLRCAAISVVTPKNAGDAPFVMSDKKKISMPGVSAEATADEFYGTLARGIAGVADKVGKNSIGFCFSYPAQATPECDAKLIRWTKNIRIPEVVGQFVGTELSKRCTPKPDKVVVLNDTIAALLAGKATESDVHYSAYIGFILGTGTNTAYVERNANIKKITTANPDGAMCINSESGAFDKIEQSEFDKAMDSKTCDPGHARFEKMIAGAYLGQLGLEVFKSAAENGFFSKEAADKIAALATLESIDFDNFCAGVPGESNPLNSIFEYAADAATARKLGTPVFERAAILTAIHLAAFIIKTGGGTDPANPVCVNVDGSTFYKTRTVDFSKTVKAELDAMLGPRHISYAITYVDDAPMIGAAVAALMK